MIVVVGAAVAGALVAAIAVAAFVAACAGTCVFMWSSACGQKGGSSSIS